MKGPAQVSQLCLAHMTGRTTKQGFNSTTTTTHWVLHPLGAARRPASGTEIFDVYCGNCQKAVQVAVAAESVTLKKQRSWRIAGWLIVFVMVAMSVTAVVAGDSGTAAGIITASVLLLPVGLTIALTAKSVYGVRVSGSYKPGVHSIRKRPVR